MKELILFICATVLFPVMLFAQPQARDQAVEIRAIYMYDWETFKSEAQQTTDRDGN